MMFISIISREAVNKMFTMLFQNLGLVDEQTDLIVNSIEVEDDIAHIEADIDVETIQ